MRRCALSMLGLVAACGGGKVGATGKDAGASDAAAPPLPASCNVTTPPPKTLECTGLYADIAAKTLSPGVQAYAPAVPLWSDGAEKKRWIQLPAGTKIDASDPNEWSFPVGTKVWKEFSRDGKRVETRMFEKLAAHFWVDATYAWNAEESSAVLSAGGDVPWGDGDTYHIPTSDECQQCHRGRTEKILGFEAVSLGLPGATGLTLAALVDQGLIAPAPAATALAIGDDGTGGAGPALSWLHINCGTTCHNGNSNSTAYGSGLRLRLDPAQLDGRAVGAFDPVRTTLGVATTTPDFAGETRIVPGHPEQSLLIELISRRGGGNSQMPPIASRIVDTADVQRVSDWVARMPALDGGLGAKDGGPVDGGRDGGVTGHDAGTHDAGTHDAGTHDAGALDAGHDAGTHDAGALDAGALDAGHDAGALDAGHDAGAADAGPPTDGGLVAGQADVGPGTGLDAATGDTGPG